MHLDKISTACVNLTGRFPKKISRDNECMLAGYYYNCNFILGEVIKNRHSTTITKAWVALHNQFKLAVPSLETYVMDNEMFKDLFTALKQEEIEYQLVTLCKH